ncbi:MAG TPA: hypothetical protein VMM35_00170 [Longimicrobiales bacterium]|nr:hypothetical protein [Longimicrobiales bacterium]
MAGAEGEPYDPRDTHARYASSALRATRILYVDDDPLLLLATGRMLRRAGATCLLAGTHAFSLHARTT